ncbi:M16 family metallopeptidase [Peijinzhouia sedimentorum]
MWKANGRRISLLAVGLICFGFIASAQQLNLDQAIPTDPNVKIGKLDNGLTYYVRENNQPENKMELRLVVKAGSILEEDNQQGLAHFMEHMGFNGSTNFSENELISFLQKMGVEFGADLNAYTSFDETVYILPIPLNEPENIEKGLLVLSDWAFGALLTDKDIDDERGVVVEEWRTGRGASQRMSDRYFGKLFQNSRYAERLPIGKVDILRNFEYDALRSFYKDWYRPDLMSVVAVGDMDVNEMTALIEKYFGKQQNPANSRERKYFEVPGHEETIVAIETDPEQSSTQVEMYIKHPKIETNTLADYRKAIIRSAYSGMLNLRLNELRQQADPPFIGAGVGVQDFVATSTFFSMSAAVPQDGIIKGFEAVLRENERVARHGFTEGELERYKKQYLASQERAFNDRDKTESGVYTNRYVSNFLSNSPIPSTEFRYEFAQQVLPTITVAEVNNMAKELFLDENRVIIVLGPEAEGLEYPTEQDLLEVLTNVENEELEPYEDTMGGTELLPTLPPAGSVVSQTENAALGIVDLELSNGVKVTLKPTEFKNDEIVMSASAKGGQSLYPDEDHFNASFASSIVANSGVGQFSSTDLQKLLAGKNARVSPSIGMYSQSISGNTTPKDLETMLQLTHLYFTQPYKNEDFFKSFQTSQKAQLAMIMASPDIQFQIAIGKLLTQNNPRGASLPTAEDIDALSLDRMLEIYMERFADASGFHFTFVGNFDVEAMKPLLAQYLGSLPASNKNETYRDLGLTPPSGNVEEVIRVGQDDKAMVVMVFSDEDEYTLENSEVISQMGEILTIKLIETLREEIGGVYGASAGGSAGKTPSERYQFIVQFPCAPENVEKLTEATWREIEKLKTEGPTAEDLAKVHETKKRQLTENKERNGYWLGRLSGYQADGIDREEILNSEARIESVTPEAIKAAANKYLTKEQYIRILKLPQE